MRNKIQTALGAVLLVTSAAVSAQVYGVISAGTSRISLDCTGAAACDKTGNSFKLLGGYKFSPNLAAELGYFDFGKAKASDSVLAGSVKTTAFGGGVAFHQDLTPAWRFVGRLGIAQVKTKIDATLVGVGSASDSDNNVQPYFGVGVGYKLNKDMSVDLAWDATKSKYSKNGASTSGNVNAYSIGLTFGF